MWSKFKIMMIKREKIWESVRYIIGFRVDQYTVIQYWEKSYRDVQVISSFIYISIYSFFLSFFLYFFLSWIANLLLTDERPNLAPFHGTAFQFSCTYTSFNFTYHPTVSSLFSILCFNWNSFKFYFRFLQIVYNIFLL